MTDGIRLALAGALPGGPQLASGRRLAGAVALTTWLGLLAVVFVRWERLLHLASGSVDDRVALITLITVLAAVCTWSVREVRRGSRAASRAGPSPLSALVENPVTLAGALAVSGLFLLALLAPVVAPYDPTLQGDLVDQRLLPPSGEHFLGTDQFGRDVLSRLLYGGRVSLAIGLSAAGISVAIGTVVGALAGYFGGVLDSLIMRGVDVVISFPRIVLLITVVALFQPSIFLIVLVLGLTQWTSAARLVRGEVLALREREFIVAATALGFSRRRVIFRHLIPNSLAPVIVAATLGVGDAIILEAGLSFLGLGAQPPTPSWGGMVADGRNHLFGAWWLATFPGLAIVMVVLAFNLVGDGVRDALDPRVRG